MVKFTYVDGTDISFDPANEFLAREMFTDVWRKAMKMDDDFEMEGKNVDDMWCAVKIMEWSFGSALE